MIVDSTAIQARDPLRAEHDQLIEQFLAKGGQIERLAHVERAPIRQPVWNGGITRNAENRRSYLELEGKIAEHGRALANTGLTATQALKQLRKRWGDQVALNVPKIEQIAARYGYAYPCTGRGRP